MSKQGIFDKLLAQTEICAGVGRKDILGGAKNGGFYTHRYRQPGRAGTFNRCEGNKICPRQFERQGRRLLPVVRRAPAI